jgi:phospholipid/cholesterol/gamma-HCH transport system substrate-binding protein
MNSIVSPFKVGLLVLVSISSFLYFSVNVRSKLEKDDGNISVFFYLNDATGLTPKSMVTIAGINVGQINKISLSGNKAKVELILKKETKLNTDAVVFKKNSSILGDSYIELTTGITPPLLQNGDEIKLTRETASMGGMMNKFDGIATDIKDMTSSLNKIISDQNTSDSIKNTVSKLEDITVKINKLLENNNNNVDKIMDNVKEFTEAMKTLPYKYDGKIDKILSDTSKSVELVRDIIGENREQMKTLLISANKILNNTSSDDINKTIKNLEEVSASLNRVIKNVEEGKGTAGKLLKSEKIHDDVEYIVDEASELVSKVSGVDLIVDAHSEYLFNSMAGNHEFGLRVQPKPNKYYYLGITASPYKVLSSSKTYYWGDNPQNQSTLKETIYSENTISFNLYMAYSLYFMTFKYGVFDSTAGMGIDFSILNNLIVLDTRINEFSDEINPNLRIGIRYYPFETWFINLGSVYLLDDRRDFYLGLGATFTDDDIKSVLTFGSLSSAAGSMK